MPELPEVETIRRQLAPFLEGRRLEGMEVLDARWCEPADPRALEDAVAGRVIEQVGRRGKDLILSLEDDVHPVRHRRRPGTLRLAGGSEPPKHLRVRFTLEGGDQLYFVDVRRFGTGAVLLG